MWRVRRLGLEASAAFRIFNLNFEVKKPSGCSAAFNRPCVFLTHFVYLGALQRTPISRCIAQPISNILIRELSELAKQYSRFSAQRIVCGVADGCQQAT